ncbi:MAG TPA: dTDP-4-dehydrorhamnose reductase [Coriobacteriia bacterium]
MAFGRHAAGGATRPVLIAGAGGMLGTALQRVLTERGAAFAAPPESAFDITDPGVVSEAVRGFASASPGGLLVNAAAYTNVERAEDDADTAFRVNEHGARLLASAARDAGLGFVHVSTDFVFDGTKKGAYVESDAPNPLSVYGASKLAGERAVTSEYPEALIARTAWVFGAGGENFPLKILRAARGAVAAAAAAEARTPARPLRVVTDEIGSPTYTVDLATCLLDLAEANAGGVFHVAGAGSCSRYEMAVETLRLAGADTPVEPALSATFPTRATRPANSVLDCGRAAAVGVVMPEWRDGLARFVAEAQP